MTHRDLKERRVDEEDDGPAEKDFSFSAVN